uniref:Uncharacterized protein n=1 Tax=Arundo donax TaxID=35708 RepID=A0A0A9BU74_ARUDO
MSRWRNFERRREDRSRLGE